MKASYLNGEWHAESRNRMIARMIIHGGRSLRDGALAAAAITLTIWLVFVVLFRYPLYTGLLFGGY